MSARSSSMRKVTQRQRVLAVRRAGHGRPGRSIQFGIVLRLCRFRKTPRATFMTLTESSGTDYIFGTRQRRVCRRHSQWRHLGFKKAATKNFDPSVAGTYKAVYYQKPTPSTWPEQPGIRARPRSGTPTVTVDSTATCHRDRYAVQRPAERTALSPVADTSYLYVVRQTSWRTLLRDCSRSASSRATNRKMCLSRS